jgi:hypothetical protein
MTSPLPPPLWSVEGGVQTLFVLIGVLFLYQPLRSAPLSVRFGLAVVGLVILAWGTMQ